MLLEKTVGPLHDFSEWLFEYIEELTEARPVPQESNGWYQVTFRGRVCLYLFISGKLGRKMPNSVHLATIWNEEFRRAPWAPLVKKEKNWFGGSADLYIRPENSDDAYAKELAKAFIRRAFAAIVMDAFSEEAPDSKIRGEFGEKVAEIVKDTPKAPEAKHWIIDKLSGVSQDLRDVIIDLLAKIVIYGVKEITPPGI